MKNKNLVSMTSGLIILMAFGLCCQLLKPKAVTTDKHSDSNQISANSESKPTSAEQKKEKSGEIVSPDEKYDFKLTAEEFHQPYKDWANAKGEKAKDEKYDAMQTKFPEGKIVEITGRVKFLMEKSTEKSTSEDMKYHIGLKTGGMFEFIMCYFDEANKTQFEKLKKDQQITLKGMIMFYPSIKHTTVVEGN